MMETEWSDIATGQETQRIVSNHHNMKEARKSAILESLEGPWYCQCLYFRLIATITVKEKIYVFLSQLVCDNFYGSVIKLIHRHKAFFPSATQYLSWLKHFQSMPLKPPLYSEAFFSFLFFPT